MNPAYIIWCICAAGLAVLGILSMRSEKPAGFFANVAAPEKVSDVRKYNRAVGRLLIGYAAVLVLTGLPLLSPKPGALIIVVMLGTVFGMLGMMLIYTLVITPKYIDGQDKK